MKNIYLVRHGNACGGLTAKGVEEIKQTASEIKEEIGSMEKVVIYHSPSTRTKESAEIIAGFFDPANVQIEAKGELYCDNCNMRSIVNIIDSTGIIVSHQPDLHDYLRSQGIYGQLSTGDFKKLEM